MLTYHVGYGNAEGNDRGEDWVNKDLYVQRHEFEGRLIAKRGSEWAAKVLRREDMEVSSVLAFPCLLLMLSPLISPGHVDNEANSWNRCICTDYCSSMGESSMMIGTT